MHRECFGLFPDEMFADLFCDVGRRSVPPMIVAVVIVSQRIEGCAHAAALLAAVVGEDLDEGQDDVFRIARRVAKDRIISTVDPQARHGHKTSAALTARRAMSLWTPTAS